jgi:hypothetical protein
MICERSSLFSLYYVVTGFRSTGLGGKQSKLLSTFFTYTGCFSVKSKLLFTTLFCEVYLTYYYEFSLCYSYPVVYLDGERFTTKIAFFLRGFFASSNASYNRSSFSSFIFTFLTTFYDLTSWGIVIELMQISALSETGLSNSKLIGPVLYISSFMILYFFGMSN